MKKKENDKEIENMENSLNESEPKKFQFPWTMLIIAGVITILIVVCVIVICVKGGPVNGN